MKIIPHKIPLLAGALLAVVASTSRADVVEYSTGFADSSSITTTPSSGFGYNPAVPNFRYDFGSSNTTYFANNTPIANQFAWSSVDAGGDANSGSVMLAFNLNTVADGGGAQLAFTIDLFAFAGTITNASSISFDIMVDPSSPADASYNGYGYLQVVTRDENYGFVDSGFADNLGNPTYGQNLAGTWEHIVVPVSGVNSRIRALTITDYSGADRNMNGVLKMYLDNLTINAPGVILPPTNHIAKPDAKGLYVTSTTATTVDAPQYQRQGIRSVANNLSWYGSPNPVSYSITISNYPAVPNTNFITYLFLVPGAPTSVNPDYAENHCAYLDIENRPAGAEAIFRWKVNDGSANDQLYGSGQSARVSDTSMIGTWTLTFDNNTNITITSPHGNVVTTNMPDFDAEVLGGASTFANPLVAYVGCQGNSVDNLHHTAVIASVLVQSNSTALLSDSFTTATVDPSKWNMAAEDPSAVVPVPPSAPFLVTWNLPDNGFGLRTTTNLAAASQASLLPVYTIGLDHGVVVPKSQTDADPIKFFFLRSPP